MLPLSLVEQIQYLLQDGQLSNRKIAAMLNVSRGTVNAIASGKRGIYGKEAADDFDSIDHQSPPVRCAGCGGLVYMPCILCEARKFQQRRSRLKAMNTPPPSHRRVA